MIEFLNLIREERSMTRVERVEKQQSSLSGKGSEQEYLAALVVWTMFMFWLFRQDYKNVLFVS